MASAVHRATNHLGTFADMDTEENTPAQEKSSVLLATIGAGVGNALAGAILDVETHTDDDGHPVYTDTAPATDHVRSDLGTGTVTARIDRAALLHGIVTFCDGSIFDADFGTVRDGADTSSWWCSTAGRSSRAGGIDTIAFTAAVSTGDASLYQTDKDDHDVVRCGPGTRIATPLGPKRAGRPETGDPVTTRDDGPQPIRWIGKHRRRFDAPHSAQPVRFAKSAFGGGRPKRDRLLSPNHRMLVEMAPTEAQHDPLVALAPAKALTRSKGIRAAAGPRAIICFGLLRPRHPVLIAEGIAVESLYPGPEAGARLTGADRSRWLRLAARTRVAFLLPARRCCRRPRLAPASPPAGPRRPGPRRSSPPDPPAPAAGAAPCPSISPPGAEARPARRPQGGGAALPPRAERAQSGP